MVFESVVADLLNSFLGDFVDNLDASQLNIGIWGGDVKLKNLEIKDTALDSLELPVKLKFGCLDKLVLKIPWKYLYTEPVIADVEGLYMVIVPNQGMVYNEERAKKNDREAKQKALDRLEENRRNKRKPKDPQQDTFTEKLIAQVIKNLQVRIKNIHIRYEDKYTDRTRPFAAGVSLQSLNFETTTSDWKATIHKESMKIFYKLVHLNSLAVYWNSHTKLISDLSDRNEIRQKLVEMISTTKDRPADFKYIIEPIQMDTKLKLNQKPEADGSNWSIPKVDLGCELERLALCVNRNQYQELLLFLEAQERFNLSHRCLRYRPNLNVYHGHYKEWWQFAYKVVLEENVRRRRRNWAWSRMKAHRKLVRDYRKAWIRHETEKNLPADVTELIQTAESKLDTFNLNIAREQANMEIDRHQLTRLEDQPQGWGAWAKSWFGGGAANPKTEQKAHEGNIIAQLEQAMSADEKRKLFDAIDYEENTPATDYPKHYVENRLNADLKLVSVRIEDALELQFRTINAQIAHRSAARAFNIKSSIHALSMTGAGKSLLSVQREDVDWMQLVVDITPEEGDFEYTARLYVAPLTLRYFAPAISKAIEVFNPPQAVRLAQLSAAATAKYEETVARSTTGLQQVVDQRQKLRLDMDISQVAFEFLRGEQGEEKLLAASVHELGFQLQMRTYEIVAGAHLGTLKVLVCTAKGTDTSMDLSGVECSLVIRDKETSAQAKLDTIQMIDETPNATHKHMLAVVGQDGDGMFRLDYVAVNRTDEERKNMRVDEHDMRVKVRLKQLRYVFLNVWLERMLNWLNLFQNELSEAIARAQQVASEKAAETAQNMKKMLEQNPQRILLDVELNAPAVVVPRLSTANQVLLFDFGRLLVKNSFNKVKSAVMDNIVVTMKDMHAASGLLDRDPLNVMSQCNMLKPLTLTLAVHRNLSFATNKDVPAITLDAKLPLIDLSMSEQDYALVMQTVSGNLAEGSANRPTPAQVQQQQAQQRKTASLAKLRQHGQGDAASHTKVNAGDDNQKQQQISAAVQKQQTVDSQQVVFYFKIDEVDARLYLGETGLEGKKGLVERIDTNKFAQMTIGKCKVTGSLDMITQAQDVAVSVATVNLKVSPAVLRLSGATVGGDQDGEKSEKSLQRPPLKEYPGYFEPKPLEHNNYWWFTEVAQEAREDFEIELDVVQPAAHREYADFSVDRITIKVVTNIDDTAPVIALESSLMGFAQDWTGRLSVDATMAIQADYYNETHKVWEPLIEAVERQPDQWERWRLNARVRTHSEEEMCEGSAGRPIVLPRMTIDLMSAESLNLTVTKSFLQLLFALKQTVDDEANERRKSLRLPIDTERVPDQTLHFRNQLPLVLRVVAPSKAELKGGEDAPVEAPDGGEIHFEFDYDDCLYTGQLKVRKHLEDLEMVTMKPSDSSRIGMHLGVHWATEHARKECSVFAPYWIVNNTGKDISYASDFEIKHSAEQSLRIMPFPDTRFQAKKKARLRVGNSALSDAFPIDTAGNAGRITCADSSGFVYELTVDVQLCQSGLTKIVTFTAFYLLQNSSKHDIEVCEYSRDGFCNWMPIQAETCLCLWPAQNTDRKMMCARYAGQKEESAMFPFTENFEEFCPTESNHIGFFVACTVAESSSVINIDSFSPGMASALLINDTDMPITYVQQGLPAEAGYTLQPRQQRIFTYTDVTRKERAIEWSSGKYKGIISLIMDNLSSYEPSDQRAFHYWASFLNGRQRTILFTPDLGVATMAKEAYEIERMEQQIELSLQGFSLSLVNNATCQEILVLGLSSSEKVWESKVRARYQPFNTQTIKTIEDAYQEWIKNGKPKDTAATIDAMEIDFAKMIMRHKNKTKEVYVRRSYHNGVWLLYRSSAHQTQMHLKLANLQLDNQLPAAVFPCVVSVVRPPPSIVADNVPKPFAEVSFIMMQSEHSKVAQVKYCRLLVQELDVRIDKGLAEAVLALFSSEQISVPYTVESFKQDLELAQPKLRERIVATKASKKTTFFHDFHIAPLLIHFSFSQGGASQRQTPGQEDSASARTIERPSNRVFQLVQVMMKSIGVSVTEVQDAVFKLAYFDRKHTFYNQLQLQTEIQSHYTKQFVKQLYVLVLGLDVIGNPYGLVMDVGGGVQDLFYQPFQGAIQGPEEFVEGVALGINSLFSHTVGGAAGVVSRITGTMGKGIAALTLDDEYQRKRQEALNRQPQNFYEGMGRSVGVLGQGVMSGVRGVFTKPIEGARQEGFGGFIRGMGKGVVGAVMRPASGVVDFASGTINTVKSVATNYKGLTPLRPARYIAADGIVRPFNYSESCGLKIFRDTDHGAHADTDIFIGHAYVDDHNVFIITNKRVFLTNRTAITGSWHAEWSYEYQELLPPQRIRNGVKIGFKQKRSGFLGLNSSAGKGIKFYDEEVANRINDKLEAAYKAATSS